MKIIRCESRSKEKLLGRFFQRYSSYMTAWNALPASSTPCLVNVRLSTFDVHPISRTIVYATAASITDKVIDYDMLHVRPSTFC